MHYVYSDSSCWKKFYVYNFLNICGFWLFYIIYTNQPVLFDCMLLNRGNKCYQEMGFSKRQAQLAIDQFETVQQALDSLLSGQGS